MFKCLIHLELIFVSGVRCAVLSQSCPTLCDITDCSLPGSSVHGNSPGENTGVDCHALPQGIFPTQESNLGLPYCRQILYCLSYQGSPTGVGSLSLLQGIFPTQGLNLGLPYCRQILHFLSHQESPQTCWDSMEASSHQHDRLLSPLPGHFLSREWKIGLKIPSCDS